MEVILLERVKSLGQMGDVVNVRPGYARNFLLPKKKALRATKENIAYFEGRRADLEAHNLKEKKEAEAVAKRLEGTMLTMIRQASEAGHLYGSVSSKDIGEGLTKDGVKVTRSQVLLAHPIKELGVFEATVHLHPEVDQMIRVNVALSEDEAKVQKERFDRGEAPVQRSEDDAA